MKLPLEGIRILDLSTMYPGPLCTMLLADFGAEVIRIEPPNGGDLWRQSAPRINGLGMPYLQVNRNKKSMTLNLKSQEARDIFYKLTADADVIVEQYRPGVAARLGIDYETIKKINPRIVYCSISGFGQDGPYRLLSGHDINYISYAGILALSARKGERPALPGVQIGDVAGGALYAAIGILTALMGAKDSGMGQYIDTAMFDGAVSLMAWNACGYLAGGADTEPESNILIGQLACYNVYETADGRFISLGSVEAHLWANFCRRIDKPEYIPLQREAEAQEEMKAYIGDLFKSMSFDRCKEYLDGLDCCWSPVATVAEALEDPQVKHRAMVREMDDPMGEYGRVKLIGNPIKLSETPARMELFPPRKGEHSAEILEACGYTPEQISAFYAEEII